MAGPHQQRYAPQSDPTPQLTAEPCMHVIDLRACLPVMLGLGSSFRHSDRRNTCNMDCLAEKPCTYSPRSQAPGTCAAPRPLLLLPFSPCVYCTPGWRRPEGGGVLCAAIRPKFGSGICGWWCRGGMQLLTRSRRHRWLPAPQGKEEHPYLQLDSEQPCKHMGMVCMESRTV